MTKEKHKIGLVFDDSLDSVDGVAQYVKTLGQWLSSQGYQVRYLVGETKLKSWAGGKIYSLSRNARVAFNRNRLSIPLPASRRAIKKILENENFDVLHVQVPHSPFLAQKVIRSANERVAVVGTFHILPSGKLAQVGSKGLRAAYAGGLKRFDQVVSVSEPAASFAKEFFGLESMILPNVVDTKHFSAATHAPTTNPRIVFLGRLVQRKGAIELLKAFNILHMSVPQARLVIAGDGPERKKLQRYADKVNLSNAVEFRGKISESEKPELLASADIACFPATGGESFGIVLLEAMAAGARVVLGGDNPGYRSVLGAQPELLVDPSDLVKFAQRLKHLLADEAVIEKLHRWQVDEVQKYDVAVVGKSLVQVYDQAIAKRSKKRHNKSDG